MLGYKRKFVCNSNHSVKIKKRNEFRIFNRLSSIVMAVTVCLQTSGDYGLKQSVID